MKHQEYDLVLSPSELPHECRLLYCYLRRHVDYATWVVGAVRKISYQGIAEHLEYLPHVRSSESAKQYSRQQIKRYIKRLVDEGFIVPQHDRKVRSAMEFFLPLAADAPQIPSFSPRHNRDTVTPTHVKPVLAVVGGSDCDTTATQLPRHTSGLPFQPANQYINNTRETFSMSWGWRPSKQVEHDLVERYPITEDLYLDALQNFRGYWVARQDERRVEWDTAFQKHYKIFYEKNVANEPLCR